MSLTFPASPSVGDTYTVGARTWTWSGTIWEITGSVAAAGSIGTTELADSAITTAKIAAGAVAEADIAANAVTQAKLHTTLSGVTICTSSTRPASPFTGQTIFETDTNLMKVWLGTGWSNGTAHTQSIAVEYLVIAGGGGSGTGHAGGGGAGGYRSSVAGETSGANSAIETPLTLAPGTYGVTVGAGGNGTTYTGGDSGTGTSGSNSVFSTITSTGGGRSGTYGTPTALSGGSGGGAGGTVGGSSGSGAGTALQGFAGGVAIHYIGGGGGGAGGVGAAASGSVAGAGGAGISSSITGTAVSRAGGGGGGAYPSNYTGGSATAGGAAGNAHDYNVGGGGVSGTANTGGGGGGSGGNWSIGGAGGSGVVIVRYLTSAASGLTITGGTATTSGSYTVRTFNSSGSLVIA